jgi:hypothetical protein
MVASRHFTEMLRDGFNAVHTDAAVEHFQNMLCEFQKRDWEQAILKGGKCVEAVLKALWMHTSGTLPAEREFKAGKIMDDLERLPKGGHPDTIRITIPRACRFVYDIASNRGARHDPGEIDPNEMDANIVVSNCSWIMAEILRYSQKGAIDFHGVSVMISTLTQKRYPFIEEVDGRIYFHLRRKKSARTSVLLTLWRQFPARVSKQDLIRACTEVHHFTLKNAKTALSRLVDVTDDNGKGDLRLLAPGLEEAEAILADYR